MINDKQEQRLNKTLIKALLVFYEDYVEDKKSEEFNKGFLHAIYVLTEIGEDVEEMFNKYLSTNNKNSVLNTININNMTKQ